MDEGTRAGLELHRRRWIAGIVVLAFATFLGGPVTALLLGSVLLQLVFPLGFELSRPVARNPLWDFGWAAVVYGSSFLFVPGIVAVALVTGPLTDAWFVALEPDLVEQIGGVFYGASVLGAFVAAWHIHRRRGRPDQSRPLLRALWFIPVGLLVGTFGGTLLLFPGFLVGIVPIVAFLGVAAFRVWRPFRAVSSGRTEAAVGAEPTFTPFRR